MDNGINTREQRGGANSLPELSFDTQDMKLNQTPTASEIEDNDSEQNEKKPNFTPPTPPVIAGVSGDDDDNDDSDAGVPTQTAPTGTIEEQNPEVAVDSEKLEREWVAKTEQVIKRTENDPKEEEIETNELKADYMAKRFNRHLGDRN